MGLLVWLADISLRDLRPGPAGSCTFSTGLGRCADVVNIAGMDVDRASVGTTSGSSLVFEGIGDTSGEDVPEDHQVEFLPVHSLKIK